MSTDGLTYDTGALVAAEPDNRVMWSLHSAALRRGLPPVVPAGVLAARADHHDIVDVSVAEGAARRNHAVVTSNADHIRKVATAAGAKITIHVV